MTNSQFLSAELIKTFYMSKNTHIFFIKIVYCCENLNEIQTRTSKEPISFTDKKELMTAKQLKVYKLFEKTYGEEEAKVIVTYFDEKNEAMKMEFATKKDLSDMKSQLELQLSAMDLRMSAMELRLIGRLDTHFKWLVGLIISVAGLSIAISKML